MARMIAPRYTPEQYRQRPRDYDPSLADQIIERIGNGELLPEICIDEDMPLPGTFLRWVELDPTLANDYAGAKRRGTEVNLDEMVVSAMQKDPGLAGIQSRAWKDHVQMTDPARYGPRAVLVAKEEDTNGGVDYKSEVRRRLDALSAKVLVKAEQEAE